jgi:hypothetical protein
MVIINNTRMKRLLYLAITSILFLTIACSEEEELLITDRSDAYISRFSVRGLDNITKLAEVTINNGIDTVALAINATVKYGNDIKMLKPDCSLSPESILIPEEGSPKLGTWVDFSKGPYKYTVVSGNRQVRRTYTITVSVEN